MKIFVSNLPFNASERELEAWVQQRGFPVDHVQIIIDRETGRSMGYGFITLQDPLQRSAAVKKLHGMSFAGRALKVEEAHQKVETSRR